MKIALRTRHWKRFRLVLLCASILAASALLARSLQSSSLNNARICAPAPEKADSTTASPASSSTIQDATAQSSDSPASSAPARPRMSSENRQGMVWVNTDTGVYHRKGSRWYGKTKHGKYMLEEDAIKAGYKAAK